MIEPLSKYSLVEVVKLLHHAQHYNGWRINQHPPAVGDRGTVVDVLRAAGHVAYVVEFSNSDGVTVCLGDFEHEELRPASDAI